METLAVPPQKPVRAAGARPLRMASESTALACVCNPKQEAVALLSQVLARLHGLDVPVVQFIQVSADATPAMVARHFAEASLTRLGRTLLASLRDPGIARPSQPDGSAGTATVRRRARKPANDAPDILPDAALHGLYHARIGLGCGESNQVSHVPPAIWLGEARIDFRLLVLDCGPLERTPAAVELVSRCHGSILTVEAGATQLSAVRAAAQQVQIAGGTLLGSVMYNAPYVPATRTGTWMQRVPGLRRRSG
jgi:hypothetical protein